MDLNKINKNINIKERWKNIKDKMIKIINLLKVVNRKSLILNIVIILGQK